MLVSQYELGTQYESDMNRCKLVGAVGGQNHQNTFDFSFFLNYSENTIKVSTQLK